MNAQRQHPGNDRYAKQILFAGIGDNGQKQLRESRVLLCGCGALGTVLADTMTRAGVGFLRIVDRDFVEMSNLQRQTLFDEDDVAAHLPKAVAATEKLARINSEVKTEPHVADIDHTNILSLVDDVDLILDGTDNFEVRFLINDAAHETGLPWIYSGVIGSHGQTMAIFPGKTGCLRCLMDTAPEPGATETCDTAGVIGPAVNVISSLASVSALKILTGQAEKVQAALTIVDVWDGTFRQMSTERLRDTSHCPACHEGERLWLSGREGSHSTILCGRNAVQVSPSIKGTVVLEELASKLRDAGEVEVNKYLLRLTLTDPDYEMTVFRDGRAIIKGTEDIAQARGIYSRYIGS